MKSPVPEKVSQSELTFKVEEIEPLLSHYPMALPKFEPVTVTLKDGRKMLVRELKKEECPACLAYIKTMLDHDTDFYDIVCARLYAEILGWYRNRLKDPFQFIGIVDGKMVALANGRLINEELALSLHTTSYDRGGRIGAIMYYLKTMYAFDMCGVDELHSTFESYNGWKRWGLGMAQPSYPWPDYQHELGGATIFYITKKILE